MPVLVPQLVTTLRSYTRAHLLADLLALDRSGLLEEIGAGQVFGTVDEALEAGG